MDSNKCDNNRRMPIHQLNKLDVKDISRYDIFPLSVIQAIFDANTGYRLDSILSAINFLFIPYKGTVQATRLQIPLKGRHRSLILSYIDYDKNIHIEQYVSDCFRDASWQCDKNWKCPFSEGTYILNVGDEKLTELLINIFYEYIKTPEFIAIAEKVIRSWLTDTEAQTMIQNAINEELDKRKIVYYEDTIPEVMLRIELNSDTNQPIDITPSVGDHYGYHVGDRVHIRLREAGSDTVPPTMHKSSSYGLQLVEGDNWIDGDYIITEEAINNASFKGKNVARITFNTY